MLYELLMHGDSVGFFPTEADARHHAAYMPRGLYTVREWIDDGEFLVYNRETCRILEIDTQY
ncbi:hypothetical protein D1647_18235 [Alistipes sp. Z76]|nr:hypothetical protein [Alistipes sp. Z76]NCE70105.1 hypothetical protein [Muribaculaceae bacterium M3]